MRRKRSSILTKIIVFSLIIYACVNLISLRGRIEDARGQLHELRVAVAAKELRNAELEYEIENHNNPDVIANIARTQLGLVMPGEIVFYDGGIVSSSVSDANPAAAADPHTDPDFPAE